MSQLEIIEEIIEEILNKKKGLICKEFEKVCPTEASFKRMIKEMHNVSDRLKEEIMEVIKEAIKEE